MTEQISCHECGHDIDDHRIGDWGNDNCHQCFDCPVGPSDIARSYADERVRDALRPVPTDKEQEVMTEHRLQLVDDDDAITAIFDMRLKSALGDRRGHHE